MIKSILVGVAAGAALTLWRRVDKLSFEGKSVVITGGARGLGLVLARQFVDQGARVAICSRHEDELARAVADL